jgi:virulence-associated protein VapD
MYAIAFDLTVSETRRHHPKGVAAAYTDISDTLGRFGFQGIQGSVYVCEREDMANLFEAITALRSLPWFQAVGPRHPRLPHRAVVGLHGVIKRL